MCPQISKGCQALPVDLSASMVQYKGELIGGLGASLQMRQGSRDVWGAKFQVFKCWLTAARHLLGATPLITQMIFPMLTKRIGTSNIFVFSNLPSAFALVLTLGLHTIVKLS